MFVGCDNVVSIIARMRESRGFDDTRCGAALDSSAISDAYEKTSFS